jgi:inorganic pyrophosphatase
MIPLSGTYVLIYLSCLLGIVYALINYCLIASLKIKPTVSNRERELQSVINNSVQHSEVAVLRDGSGELMIRTNTEHHEEDDGITEEKIQAMKNIGSYITEGANAFLFQEYKILAVFCFIFAIFIKFAIDKVDNGGTTIAFIFGVVTSVVSGYLGMRIAVYSNYRTAYQAQESLAKAFVLAFRAGCVMGFSLVCLSLAVMTTLIAIYRLVYTQQEYANMYDAIAGYGLGGSTIALFGRVGGGIYTKAADVGADLVGKLEENFPEDDPRNPATIADNVGDNVGDIAGMGSDLFGSFAESTCAALVVLSSFPVTTTNGGFLPTFPLDNDTFLFYPLLLSAFGVLASFVTSFFATHIMPVKEFSQIESTLKWQLIISTILLLGLLYLAAWVSLDVSPGTLYINCLDPNSVECYVLSPANAYLSSAVGLLCGMFIGMLTEYYTSNYYKPVKQVADACTTGAATNIIYGLALGYLSTIVPIILLAITAYIAHKTLGMLGLALSALGMLSNLSIGLAIDAYGPISDNAGGIAEMSHLGAKTREKTDALDAAGNTTAAIGKGFAIGSACLVSLALYGAFVTRASTPPIESGGLSPIVLQMNSVTLTDPLVFSSLLIGAMLPYGFSAMTMKSVGTAAFAMVKEVRSQLRENPGIRDGSVKPDYKKCVAISTSASLKEMIGPGLLVILTPIFIGIIFGPKAVAGLLPGALVSGVQMAISSSNTGGAWDNAKKYIEQGKLVVGDVTKKKGSDEHKAAVIGDTVGDPLKDTSGPSLNILIKLMAILSLVCASFFQRTALLTRVLNDNQPVLQPVPASRS